EAFGGVPTYILIIILFTAVSVTVGLMYENKLDTDFAESIGKKIHSIKYDSNTNAMPEGDLENLPELNKNSTPALQLTMEQPQKMYLKGRIYEVYDGTSWKKADTKETAQYEDLFYWLHKEGFYGQSQIAYASMFVSGQQAAEMTISNLSACNEFGYVPYAMYGNESLPSDMIGDNHSYSTQHIQYLAGSVPEWYKVQQNLASAQNRGNIGQYLRNEAAYEAYVKSVDLQLTNESWSVINRQLGEDTTAKTLSQIRDIINDYLSGALVYDETVKTYNGGSDFVQYTLEYSGKGYDVHYATIATLMLRYYGVPARYVEGYFLSADEAERYAAGEKIILTEEHAHAWTEYYLSGVGFIPFEVTPGYIDDEELELGAMDSENMQIYTGEHMKYASVQPPENIEEPQQSRFSFSMKPIYFVYMAGLLLAVLTALVLIRRKNFKKVMETMDAADNRHNIAMNYGYAQKLIKHCNIELPQNSIDMERLNKEAIFSNHTLDDIQRQKMKEYVQDVLDACKKKWSVVQKIRYKLWDCLY
ncbi:MAG: transglutaminase domain-containing protein, partial [Oscillospiraceae bacterium]|nr:transglutaminase domain-containing protein [Oscillospiraceae bacterium]